MGITTIIGQAPRNDMLVGRRVDELVMRYAGECEMWRNVRNNSVECQDNHEWARMPTGHAKGQHNSDVAVIANTDYMNKPGLASRIAVSSILTSVVVIIKVA
ncbi:hypothetical protein M8818_003043 [Zalaria obscura]|uniref:Uncharacterized protein n=1 Tax=Zalaria obscura TaxID=2024903 RepID=A0ACC3SHR9_9PEZI